MKFNALPFEFITSEQITLDYLANAKQIRHVFPRHFQKPSVRTCHVDRPRIVNKLLEYNRKINAPMPVIQRIESLLQPTTYAVITGQQPGLFSGPMYTVYKALSAIVLCDRLSTAKYALIPLFWNASEDHDFSEVDHITVLRDNEPYVVQYEHKATGVAFAHLNLDKSAVNQMLTTIASISPNSEFKTSLLKKSKELMQQSSTFGDFFSRVMTCLFGAWGLVMVEPHALRELMVPVFDQLIRRPTECTRLLDDAGAHLDKLGYSPRIHKKSNICNFFLLNDEGKRLRVTYNGEFQVANETFSQRDLLHLLADEPARFSANALTRPITQDFLFPTFAYVAGPNEIAYLAQLPAIYEFFSLEMPVIFPRFGATILEHKITQVLEKYHVEIQELRNLEKLLKELAREKINGNFNAFRSEVSQRMDTVIQQVEAIDATLTAPGALAKGRILKTIDILEDKVASKLKKQNLVARQQLTKASNNLFPAGHLQERQINVLEYLIKFGKEFLQRVYEDFREAEYGAHQVITC